MTDTKSSLQNLAEEVRNLDNDAVRRAIRDDDTPQGVREELLWVDEEITSVANKIESAAKKL